MVIKANFNRTICLYKEYERQKARLGDHEKARQLVLSQAPVIAMQPKRTVAPSLPPLPNNVSSREDALDALHQMAAAMKRQLLETRKANYKSSSNNFFKRQRIQL